jgi:hypothetical protein
MPASHRIALPLGLPLLRAIRCNPLGVAQQFRHNHGDIVGMTILFQTVYYVPDPADARGRSGAQAGPAAVSEIHAMV